MDVLIVPICQDGVYRYVSLALETDCHSERRRGTDWSAQTVGQAIGANPIALLIPCHRVIVANGKLGGYAYGEERKKRLLAWEQQSKFKTQ